MAQTEDSLAARAKNALAFVSAVRRAGHEELVRKTFRVAGTAKQYLSLAASINEAGLNDEDIALLVPAVSTSDIIAALTGRTTEGSLSKTDAAAIDVAARVDTDWNWGELLTATSSRLQAGSALEDDELTACLSIVFTLRQRGPADEANTVLNDLTKNGHLMNYSHLAASAGDTSGVAYAAIALVLTNPDGEQQANVGNSASGYQSYVRLLEHPDDHSEVVTHAASAVRDYGLTDSLLTSGTQVESVRPFVDAILRMLWKDEDVDVPPEIIVNHFPYLIRAFSAEDIWQIIQASGSSRQLRDHLRRLPFDPQLTELYLLARRGSDDAEFNDFLRDGLRAMNTDAWVKEFNRSGAPVELALDLIDSNEGLNLDLEGALATHAESVLQGGRKPAKYETRWPMLLKALPTHTRETFLRDLRDKLLRNPSAPIQPLLVLYGTPLLDAHLEEKADDIIRTVFRDIVTRLDADELQWMRDVLQKRSAVYASAPKTTQRTLKERIAKTFEDGLSEATDSARDLLREIAVTLNVDVPDENSPESSGDADNTE